MNVVMINKMNKNILMTIFSFMIIINSNAHYNIKNNTKIINSEMSSKKHIIAVKTIKLLFWTNINMISSSKNNTDGSDECSHKYQNTKIIIRLKV